MKRIFKLLSIFIITILINVIYDNTSFAASSNSETIDVTNNSIANCKIDGTTDDYNALTSIMNYVKSISNPVIINFPYTGSPMMLSDTIFVSRSNITLNINCNIQFTKCKYDEDSSMNVIEVGYYKYSRNPIENVKIIGNNIEINGNASNLDFVETAHTKPNFGDIIHFRRVINGTISGIICNEAVENGMRVYYCQNVTVENCEFNNTKVDNGLTVMGLPIYTDPWTYSDDKYNNNVVVRNCSARGNTDVGFSASVCRNVLFDTCVSSENGTATGFNAGGGFSHESLGYTTYWGQPNTWNGLTTFYNCTAYNNQNYGFYTDTLGTFINGCTIDTVTQNDSSTYGRNLRGGNGIFAMSSKGVLNIIDTTIKNIPSSYAIAFSNGSSQFSSALNIENITVSDTKKGIYCLNTGAVIINKANLKNISYGPLYFIDGNKKKILHLTNFTTSNVAKLQINNADKIIVDDSVTY